MNRPTFWNLIARRYARSPVADQASYAHKLALTAARLEPHMRLLEVGCGTGTTALIHAPRVARIDGIDFSPAMIEIATAKARDQGVDNVHFSVSRIGDLTPQAEPYDAVLAMSVLHLMPDPLAVLAQLAGLVRPGGLVITSTICIGDMAGILPKILPALGRTGLVPSVTRLTKSNLLDAHKALNLTLLEQFQPGPGKAVFLIAQVPH